MLLAPTPNQTVAVPKFLLQLSDDPHGVYRAFPQQAGHTLICRNYPIWMDILDGSSVLVQTDEGNTYFGTYNRSFMLTEATFHLTATDGSVKEVLQEHVAACWEPMAYVKGEVHVAHAIAA